MEIKSWIDRARVAMGVMNSDRVGDGLATGWRRKDGECLAVMAAEMVTGKRGQEGGVGGVTKHSSIGSC